MLVEVEDGFESEHRSPVTHSGWLILVTVKAQAGLLQGGGWLAGAV